MISEPRVRSKLPSNDVAAFDTRSPCSTVTTPSETLRIWPSLGRMSWPLRTISSASESWNRSSRSATESARSSDIPDSCESLTMPRAPIDAAINVIPHMHRTTRERVNSIIRSPSRRSGRPRCST